MRFFATSADLTPASILIGYLLFSLYYKWLLSWGGAEKIHHYRWLAWLFGDWTVEQIRFYALLVWIAATAATLAVLVSAIR
ncbi:hypothetical protein [Neisseria perflava]|uniref:hypothetical protein n=1 Tax=Neisseria perflava TaxID=33053 RepID=UPI00209CF4DA|nr:hypothetical protein [Neisseria perflava]MCP1659189.1 hypothetical protein [Neisseria perflava]MCP1771769.1 hypothetical protein [Neisseria perflava]